MANNAKHPQFTLLLTRPDRGAQAFWAALSNDIQSMLDPIFAPLFRIDPVAPDLLRDLSTIRCVIFSSANAPLHAPSGNQRVAYCVGDQTTRAAISAGWQAIQMGETADELVEAVAGLAPSGPLTHLSGNHTRGDIAARLTAKGIPTNRVVIYNQTPQMLSPQAQTALGRENPIILPLFSPASARQFAQQYKEGQYKGQQYKGGSALHIIALSKAVAKEISDLNAATMQICAVPTRNAMLQSVQIVIRSIALG